MAIDGWAAVIAGMDSPPVLEAAEHDFNFVPAAIKCRVVRDRHLAINL